MSTIQEWNERYALKFAGAEALPRAQRVLLSLVGSGQRVLDVGCGSGFYTTQFRDLGNKMAATDITVEGVRTVVQTGIPVTLSDVEKGLPFADESFDMVPFIEVVEHLLRPDLALREIRRILRPGGLLLLTTPNYAHWVLRLLYLFGVLPVGLRSRPYAGFASRRQADTIPPGSIRTFVSSRHTPSETISVTEDSICYYCAARSWPFPVAWRRICPSFSAFLCGYWANCWGTRTLPAITFLRSWPRA